jgi:hypothetical protein
VNTTHAATTTTTIRQVKPRHIRRPGSNGRFNPPARPGDFVALPDLDGDGESVYHVGGDGRLEFLYHDDSR